VIVQITQSLHLYVDEDDDDDDWKRGLLVINTSTSSIISLAAFFLVAAAVNFNFIAKTGTLQKDQFFSKHKTDRSQHLKKAAIFLIHVLRHVALI
jgi:hypothetical protein